MTILVIPQNKSPISQRFFAYFRVNFIVVSKFSSFAVSWKHAITDVCESIIHDIKKKDVIEISEGKISFSTNFSDVGYQLPSKIITKALGYA